MSQMIVCAIASPNLIGTAFPICLYCSNIGPQIFQSEGKPWMQPYSSTLNGRSSVGWHKSVAGMVGLVTNVGDGFPKDSRR